MKIRDGAVVIENLTGIWKRVVLQDGAGNEDRESAVYWIQAQRLCGDIRQHRRVSSLTGPVSETELPVFDAFAGTLTDNNGIFRWEPTFKWREIHGPPDEGRLSWIGADLCEEGVHVAYTEQWTRIGHFVAGNFALMLHDTHGTRLAYVLNVGGYMFYAVSPCGTKGDEGRSASAFSLFKLLSDRPELVLSTADPGKASFPRVEFADAGRKTAWLSEIKSGAARGRELWLVVALETFGGLEPEAPNLTFGDIMR